MTTTVDAGALPLAASTRDEVRTPNGNLVSVHQGAAGTLEFWFDDGAGTSWTQDTGATLSDAASFLSLADVGLFCDAAGYLHLVYIDQATTKIAYRLGTLNGAQTSVTWSTPFTTGFTLLGNISTGYRAHPSVVAHAEGTGHKVHILHGFDNAPTGMAAVYIRLNVTSGGVITQDAITVVETSANSSYACQPTIAFAHTGDGVTPQAAPHLHMVWHGHDGSNALLKYCRAAYSSGTWTLGIVRTLATIGTAGLLSALFDGARTVVLYAAAGATVLSMLERNAADTNTTPRTPPAVSDGAITSLSIAHDADGNAYLFVAGTTGGVLKWTKYTRTAGTFSSLTAVAGSPTPVAKTVHARSSTEPGHAVDVHFQQSTNVRHDRTVAINYAPTAPSWATPDNQGWDVNDVLPLDAPFADPDLAYGDTPSARAVKRDIGGTVRWWDGAVFDELTETWVAVSDDDPLVLPAGWGADSDPSHKYAVAYKDAAGAGGTPAKYSAWLTVIPDEKVDPVVTGPADASTVTEATVTAMWTSADQSAFLVELLDAAGTTVLWASDWQVDAGLGSFPVALVLNNLTDYQLGVTTKTAEGLTSNRVTVDFSTEFTVPDAAIVTITENSPAGAITIEWENPTSGDAPESVDLWVRIAAGSLGDGNRTTTPRRIGTNLEVDSSHIDRAVGSGVTYEYMVRTWGENGTYTDTEWTVTAIDGGDVEAPGGEVLDGGSP